MLLISYRERVTLDNWRVIDVPQAIKLSRWWFDGGLLYGYRDRFNVVCLVDAQIDEIEDTDYPGAWVDVEASFKAGELAYCLPF